MRGTHTQGAWWDGHTVSMREEGVIYVLKIDVLNGKPVQIITPIPVM